MSELIRIEGNLYDRYRELLLKRDLLKKEAYQYEVAYIKEFGELISDSFEAKIECIEKKKIIAYCQKIINSGGTVNPVEMSNYIDSIMKDYYDELNRLLKENKAAKDGYTVSEHVYQKIKKTYYAIAKLIHPDVNPDLAQDETIKDLWSRTVIAYQNNQLSELEELLVLVNAHLEMIHYKHNNVQIDNLEEKLLKLEEEIEKIRKTDPYLFKYLLSDRETVTDKKTDLMNEIEEYKKYAAELEEVIASFGIERIVS